MSTEPVFAIQLFSSLATLRIPKSTLPAAAKFPITYVDHSVSEWGYHAIVRHPCPVPDPL